VIAHIGGVSLEETLPSDKLLRFTPLYANTIPTVGTYGYARRRGRGRTRPM